MVSITPSPAVNPNNLAMQRQAQQAMAQANLVAANNELRLQLITAHTLERVATQPYVDAIQLENLSKSIDIKPGLRSLELNA